MSFFSTRGTSCVTASQAILQGISWDGGLFVPVMFPPFSANQQIPFFELPYWRQAASIFSFFLDDFSSKEIESICKVAYERRFIQDSAISLADLNENTFVAELFHGPTLSSKDFSALPFPHLLTAAAEKNNISKQLVTIAPTNGDSGSAIL
ncbi:MAG: threonine synthase, partial [Clostridiales bacterium]|nr:threonine synthase [Clostridiales bacterium]